MTELIWEGKYKDGKKSSPVRISLPFQTIETVNESTEDRKKTIDLFASGKQTEWRNRLIWGDKKYVLPSLMDEFAGKVNLVYIDPPFDTGADFSFMATIPDNPETEEDETTSFIKEPSMIEQKAYRDTWGKGLDSYLEWFYETLVLLKDLLSDNGSVYIHLDYHIGHYAKIVSDEVFGYDKFINEIIWKRSANTSSIGKIWKRQHDMLLNYSKNNEYTFNFQRKPLSETSLGIYSLTDEKGRYRLVPLLVSGKRYGNTGKKWRGIDPNSRGRNGMHWLKIPSKLEELEKQGLIVWPKKQGALPNLKYYLDENPGVVVSDLWDDINVIQSSSTESVNYVTQKPEALLERIIKASSNDGDLILDCFCGSGTTPAVAEKLNRNWIACDLGRFAIHTTRKRLLGIKGVKPFIVQNLGKYERQAWVGEEFAKPDDRIAQEKAYRNFIVQLYHGKTVNNYIWLHGIKSGRMIHVGSVDAPISLGDIKSIIQEFWKTSGKEIEGMEKGVRFNGIDILGWEFAFDINETASQQAAANKIDLKFKKIPREVLEKKAVEQGDIKFFELAALDVKAKISSKKVELTLKDFVIPPDDLPDDVQKAITHWSQWIDYWAVDWNYKDDTFHNEWQSYRTKKNTKIDLKTSYQYFEKGTYTVVVKVIDILGNDTTKAIEVIIK